MVVRRLRQDGCGVPVIFLTARGTEADLIHTQRAVGYCLRQPRPGDVAEAKS